MMEEEEEKGGVGESLLYSFTPHDSINQYNTIEYNMSKDTNPHLSKLHKSSIDHTYKTSHIYASIFWQNLKGGHGVEVGNHGEGWWGSSWVWCSQDVKTNHTHIHTKFDGVKERRENFVDPPFLSNLRKGLPFKYKYLLGLWFLLLGELGVLVGVYTRYYFFRCTNL